MTFEIAFVFLLLVAVSVVMTAEWLSVDLVALMLICALVLSGILTPEEAVAGFANEFILVLCAIFVLSGALVKTGIMEWLGGALYRMGARSEPGAIASIMGLSSGMSAFLSNTNSTAILVPAVLEFARRSKLNPSRLLMPLAYASMLGGACTLIGTSTNLAANGLLTRVGLRPFSMFEFLPVGLSMIVAGTAYMTFAGRLLLPKRASTNFGEEYEIDKYLSEIEIGAESELVGQRIDESELARLGVSVRAIVRAQAGKKKEKVLSVRGRIRIQAGDLLVVQSSRSALLRAEELPSVTLTKTPSWSADDLVGDGVQLAEAVLMPHSTLAGVTLKKARLRRRYDVSVLAVYRRGHALPVRIDDMALETGDVLLLQGTAEQLQLFQSSEQVWVVGEVAHLPFRKRKGFIALGAVVGAVALSSLGLLPLSIALLVATLVVVLAKVVAVEEMYALVEWPLIVLIGGMTSVGVALEKTGGADLMANWIANAFEPMGTYALLGAFSVITMLLTQPMSNAAAALVVLPVALSTATVVGLEPRSLAVLVTLSASLSFIAPLEPSCLLVFAPGKYRFRDFIVAGLPMTVIALVVLLVIVPIVWPLG